MNKEIVYNHLEKGCNNRKTYDDLSLETGLSNREIRMIIHSLRQEGYPIVSTTSKKGFYIADYSDISTNDMYKMKLETLSRINNLFAIVNCCDLYFSRLKYHNNEEVKENENEFQDCKN